MPRILSRSQMPVPRRRSSLVSTGSSRRNSFVGSAAVSRTNSPKASSPTRQSLRMHSPRISPETFGEASIAAAAVARCQQQQQQRQHDLPLSDSESFATALAVPSLSVGGSSSVAPNDNSDSRGREGRWAISPSIWQKGVFGLGASTTKTTSVASSVSSSYRNGNGNGGRNESGMMSRPSGAGGGFLPTSGLTRNVSCGYGHYVEVAEDF